MSKRISQLAAAGALSGAELVELSKPSATVTITAATISAAAADNSYNDSANGFVTAGFAVGQAVRVTGFTGSTANNILSGVITAVAAGKLTIGGTDGDVIVDDAAGESVTITAWESVRSTPQAFLASRTGMQFEKEIALSDLTTALTTGTTKGYWRPAFAASGVSARASLRVASSSGIPTVDMNKGGVSMMSTKLTIDVGELTSQTAAAPVVMSTTTWAIDDLIEFDIDVAGTGAMGLIVTVTGLYA